MIEIDDEVGGLDTAMRNQRTRKRFAHSHCTYLGPVRLRYNFKVSRRAIGVTRQATSFLEESVGSDQGTQNDRAPTRTGSEWLCGRRVSE